MMKKEKWLPAILLTTGILMTGISASAANLQKDQLAFAKCDQYINIRTQANKESAVVAKLHNKNAVTVLDIVDDQWCLVSSGNAVGYMKSKYLVTGKKAQKIADEVGYQVAVIYPKAVNVRAKADDDSRIIDVVKENQEVEVVNYNGGAWMKVALAPDSIGYIDASLCGYKTYYPVAEVVDEAALSQVSIPISEEVHYEEAVSTEIIAEQIGAYEEDGSVQELSSEETSNVQEEVYEESEAEQDYDYAGSDSEPDYNYEESSPEQNYNYEEGDSEQIYDYEAGNLDQNYNYEGTGSDQNYNYTENDSEQDYDYEEDDTEKDYYQEPSSGGYEYGYEASTGNGNVNGTGGQAIADYAVQFVGNPYVYGGTSLTNGTDCSGFTQSVMSNFGIDLARVAADQSYGGQSVSTSDILPGDLLFYSDGGGISHVALYIGDGQIVHAATEDKGIIISDYDYDTPVSASRYW